MTADPQLDSGQDSGVVPRRSQPSKPAMPHPSGRVEVACILLLAGFNTAVGWLVRPTWDDAWLHLIETAGPEAVRQGIADRPLAGYFWGILMDSGVLWPGSALLHFACWSAMGLVTVRLWRMLFPDLSTWALPAGLLVTSPITIQKNLVLATLTLTSVLPVALVWIATIVCLHLGARMPSWPRALLGSALIALGNALSEYAAAAALASLPLFFVSRPLQAGRSNDGRTRRTLALLVVAACTVGHLLFRAIADSEYRPSTGVRGITSGLDPATLPFELLVANIQGGLGFLLLPIAQLDPDGRKALLVGGTIAAALAVWVATGASSSTQKTGPLSAKPLVGLTLSLSLGVLPVLMYGRSLTPGSRFWTQVGPVMPCLALGLLTWVLRRRWWFALGALVGLGAGTSHALEIEWALDSSRFQRELSALLEPHVDQEGLTMVIVDREFWPPGRIPGSHELTARLSEDWEPSRRRRFWAVVDEPFHLRAAGLPADWRLRDSLEVRGLVRGYEVVGPLRRVVRVERQDGGATVEDRELSGGQAAVP